MTEEQPLAQSGLSNAVGPEGLDLDRITYIVKSFAWPRGLYCVAYAGWFAAFRFARVYWKDSEGSGWEALWRLASMAIPFFISIIWIPRYYTRRFGVFRPKPGPTPHPWTKNKKHSFFLLLILGSYFLLAYTVEHLTSSRNDLFVLLTALLLLVLALVDPWKRLRSIPEMSLIGMCVIVLALWTQLPLWVPEIAQAHSLGNALYEATPSATVGLTIGLYDHITLTRLIPKPVEDHHE